MWANPTEKTINPVLPPSRYVCKDNMSGRKPRLLIRQIPKTFARSSCFIWCGLRAGDLEVKKSPLGAMSYIFPFIFPYAPLFLGIFPLFPIWSYSSPHFPTSGLNMERYVVSLRIQSECGKMQTIKIPTTDTFYAVNMLKISL